MLFSVDSRGGDALASDLIWREVARIRRKKPVVVLMGEYAASGGYYVSAAANSILARRNTTTGSIGVVITRPVLSGLYERAGITPVSVERGSRAGMLDTSRPSGRGRAIRAPQAAKRLLRRVQEPGLPGPRHA